MITPIAKTQRITAEEYLVLEVAAELRSEFRNGEIVPMTGGTPAHNSIMSALNAFLWFSLRKTDYSLFIVDQRLWIPEKNLYTYPDAMVIRNPVQLKSGRKDTVTNPILIAEVLSESTQAYDRGDKFTAYQTIPTLQEYILINQTQPHVEQYVKRDVNHWQLSEYTGIAEVFSLASVDIEIKIELADLYENIQF